MISRITLTTFLFGLLVMTSSAFVVPTNQRAFSRTSMARPLKEGPNDVETAAKKSQGAFGAVAAAIMTSWAAPLVALAEEADNYEYGAVDAPIGLAWAAGIAVILTAGVPILMQGGEEAFEEMKERDADMWGKGDADALRKRK